MESESTPDREWGCNTCWPADAREAWKGIKILERGRVFIDESHFLVDIRTCPACGQRFLWVMTELIDWQDGEDPIERTVLPLTDEEIAQLDSRGETGLDEALLNTLGRGRRCLRYSWPKGAEPEVYWSTGLLVGPHD